ncbi:Peptidase S, partial [Parasponia andersonii]
MPFGSPEKAFENSSTLGFLSSTQALADYAQLIIDLKKNLSAQNCPVIALGGSYGGIKYVQTIQNNLTWKLIFTKGTQLMNYFCSWYSVLASWFRLKYPRITIEALASSAPILYFDNITPQNGYDVIVTKDFRARKPKDHRPLMSEIGHSSFIFETSESCYNTIRQSWSEIDRVAAEYFKAPFNSSQQLKDYLALLCESAAQNDNPPDDLVGSLCNIIDGAPKGTAVLGRIAAAANAGI